MQQTFTRSFLCLVILCSSVIASAQAGLCPPNIGFEQNSFNNWQCFIGTVNATGNDGNNCPTTNTITATPSAPVLGRHAVINTNAIDPFGNFPMCPDGNPVARLGFVGQTGAQIERISYTYTIPASVTNFSLTYKYAVVYQDPSHCHYDQPHFEAKVYNVTTGEYINCASFEYYATPGQNGFTLSPNNSQGPVWVKNWTPVTFILSEFAGQTIRIEFTNADCTLTGHWAYCYVDVMDNCNTPILGANYCPGSPNVSLTAPYGYQQYNWFNAGFGAPIATGQTMTITPPPPTATTYAVEVIPIPGYGCRDTIIATVNPFPEVTADAGEDIIICPGSQTGASIGTTGVANYSYSWLPTTGLNNATISEPLANPSSTTEYEVTVTDNVTGCSKKDTVLVTVPSVLSAAFTVNNASQCLPGNNFQFTPGSPLAGLTYTWDFGEPGAVSSDQNASYSYAAAGTYNVSLTIQSTSGCQETTTQSVTVNALPTATLSASSTNICEGTPVVLTATGSSASSYHWYNSNVLVGTTNSNTYSASQPGTYTFTLNDGCLNDGTGQVQLTMTKKPSPEFTFDAKCVGFPTYFTNNSTVNESLPVDYAWTFNGGVSPSSDVNPTVNYTSAGTYNVQLTVTPQNCPQLATSITKNVDIKAPVANERYPDKSTLENSPLQLQARSFGASYEWSPAVYLNSANVVAPVFNGTMDQLYTISITDGQGCVTVDTQLVKVFKESNIYMPNAFSPNNDGVNDRIFPYLVGMKELKFFRILNRWGVVVYESRTDQPGWDGKVKGVAQPIGGYVYEIRAVDHVGRTHTKAGTFTLLR